MKEQLSKKPKIKFKKTVLIGPVLERKIKTKFLHKLGLQDHTVFAIDGGIKFCSKPRYWLGDADSGQAPDSKKIISLKKNNQNESDLEFCLKKFNKIFDMHLFGFLGKRLDHELANLSSVYIRVQPGAKVFFYDKKFRKKILILGIGESSFVTKKDFSVLCLEKTKIRISGECDFNFDGRLNVLDSRGISNTGRGLIKICADKPVLVFL